MLPGTSPSPNMRTLAAIAQIRQSNSLVMRRSEVRFLVAAPVLTRRRRAGGIDRVEIWLDFALTWVAAIGIVPRPFYLLGLEGFPSGQRDQTVNLTAQPS